MTCAGERSAANTYGSDTTKGRRAPFYRFTNRFKKMNGEQTLKLWTDPKRMLTFWAHPAWSDRMPFSIFCKNSVCKHCSFG